jgi:hypothetical protein
MFAWKARSRHGLPMAEPIYLSQSFSSTSEGRFGDRIQTLQVVN